MKNYFYVDLSPINNKYLVKPNFNELPLFYTEGSFAVVPCRLLNISFANYLRLCRDDFDGEIFGKNHTYPIVYFQKERDANQLAFFLNSRAHEYFNQDTFIDLKYLKAHAPCDTGFQEFLDLYPNGAYMLDIIRDPKIPLHLIQWGAKHLELNDVQRLVYEERVKITNSDHIYLSYNINDSHYITSSHTVDSSQYIKNSKLIKHSFYVLNSSEVEESAAVKDSKKIYKSSNIIKSKTINDSAEVVNSQVIKNSKGVYNCSFIVDSYGTQYSHDVSYSAFCNFCVNGKALLFCSQVAQKELLLFNKPITYTEYRKILLFIREYWEKYSLTNFTEPLFCDDEGWRGGIPNLDLKTHYTLPSDFVDWVKTLPNYDPEIFYNIIYQDNILMEENENG